MIYSMVLPSETRAYAEETGRPEISRAETWVLNTTRLMHIAIIYSFVIGAFVAGTLTGQADGPAYFGGILAMLLIGALEYGVIIPRAKKGLPER